MFDDIADRFLDDSINVNFRFAIKQAVDIFRSTGKQNGAVSVAADRGADGMGQPEPVQLIRPQAMRNLAHFFNGLRRDPRNLIESLPEQGFIGIILQREERLIFYHEQVLS